MNINKLKDLISEVQLRIQERNDPADFFAGVHSCKVFSVTSGKGGVGKSHFSANFAIKLAQHGKSVLLIDGDLGLANLDVILGLEPRYNLYHVIKGHRTLRDIIIPGPQNISFIAGGAGIREIADLELEIQNELLRDFKYLEKDYDYIIIDTGAGLSTSVLNFILAADEVIIVTTPEPTALLDAYGIIKAIAEENFESEISVVMNRVSSIIESTQTFNKLKNVSRHFLDRYVKLGGFIFEDSKISEAVRIRRPFVLSYPTSQASKCLELLTLNLLGKSDKIAGNIVEPPGKTGFFSRLKSLITRNRAADQSDRAEY